MFTYLSLLYNISLCSLIISQETIRNIKNYTIMTCYKLYGCQSNCCRSINVCVRLMLNFSILCIRNCKIELVIIASNLTHLFDA